MKTMRCRSRHCLAPLLLMLLAAFPAAAADLLLYQEGFDNGKVPATVHALRGAQLVPAGGQLAVVVSSPGQGVSLDIPNNQINCFVVTLAGIHPNGALALGDTVSWRWIVADAVSGQEYSLLESTWTKTGSTTFTTRKKDKSGNTVVVRQTVSKEDLDVVPPAGQQAKIQWDRRTVDGVEQVQLEIVFVDPATGKVTRIVRLFPWQDPKSFSSVRIELTANFPVEISLESVEGAEEHLDFGVADPAVVPAPVGRVQ